MVNTNILDIYDVQEPREEDGTLIWGISLCHDPAIECSWHTYSENKPKKQVFFNEERMEIVSPVLCANKLIYREEGDYKYMVRFTPDAIAKHAEYMIIYNTLQNFTLNHSWFSGLEEGEYEDSLLHSIRTEEFWLTTGKDDKAYTEYGFEEADANVGSLFIRMKVLDRTLWERIKASEFRGLSIEGFLNYEQLK